MFPEISSVSRSQVSADHHCTAYLVHPLFCIPHLSQNNAPRFPTGNSPNRAAQPNYPPRFPFQRFTGSVRSEFLAPHAILERGVKGCDEMEFYFCQLIVKKVDGTMCCCLIMKGWRLAGAVRGEESLRR
jgi:hypothetical protein